MAEQALIVTVAVVQAAPVLFNRKETVKKVTQITAEVAKQNVNLILFPEAFIPAYPRGLGFGTVVGSRDPIGRETWRRYWENAVDIPSPTTKALGEAARKAKAFLAIGVTTFTSCGKQRKNRKDKVKE